MRSGALGPRGRGRASALGLPVPAMASRQCWARHPRVGLCWAAFEQESGPSCHRSEVKERLGGGRMQPEEGTGWLLELLSEVQLQQYFLRLRDDLNVTRLSHFEYVKNEDLEKIGMGRPGQRRLWEAVKRRKALCKRKSWMSKV
ncbi:TNK2 isoform 22, partial [Pan troglodytes]